MAKARLEHVNISTTDPERTAALIARLTGWHERWRGPALAGGETIHLGGDHDYIAIYTHPAVKGDFAKGVPLNHIGITVPDLDAAEAIVVEAGLEPMNHADYDPGRRFYFYDWDGIEWELVSYE